MTEKQIRYWLLGLHAMQCAVGVAFAYFTPFYRTGMMQLPGPHVMEVRSFYLVTEISFLLAYILPSVPILALLLLFVVPPQRRFRTSIALSFTFLCLLLVTFVGLMYPWWPRGGVYWQ